MTTKSLTPTQISQSFFSRKFWIPVFCITLAFASFIPFSAIGQGNLLVTPRRVVFEGSKRSLDLNLANIGNDTARYVISLVQMKMNEDGSFETITEPEPGQKFADKNIRFFPRSVTLPPKESQVVKVQTTRTSNLEPGEYRSHFYFRSEPKQTALGEDRNDSDSLSVIDTTSISIKLTPIFGITMPAIIRVGESNTQVSLSDIKLDVVNDSTQSLSLRFNRTGNFSVYGDLTIDHVSAEGEITKVGRANGIAVYTPNTSRLFNLKLKKKEGIDMSKGELKIVFTSRSDLKPIKYDEVVMKLGE